MNRRSVVISVMLCLAPAVAAGQVDTRPTPMPQGQATGPRDDAKSKDSGTARISGRVVSADTGTPLRRAEVSLSGETLKEGRGTSTDEQGRYTFADLPAGRYHLRAQKAGFAYVSYGQKRPFDNGRPLEVADGQSIGRIDLALPKGGVVSGRITDEFGEPVAGVGVRAMRHAYVNGKRQLTPIGWGSTDDRGMYRIYGLSASDYYVSAQTQGFTAAHSDSRSGFAQTYYPGTPSVTEAQRIHVAVGAEQAASFAMIPSRTAKVSGTVVDANGQPASRGMLMLQLGREEDVAFTMGYGGMIEPDGTFTISSVAPGDYVIHANLGNGGPDGDSGYLPITVLGEDLTGLVVNVTRATSIAGQVVFDGNPPEKLRPSEFMFFMHGVTFGPMSWGNELRTKDDWTLEGKGRNGPLIIDPGRFPEGWTIKAVLLNGEDVTDSGVPVASGEPIDGLQVVLTSRITRVSGSVATDSGQPARDYVVILYPEDASSWRMWSRRVQLARPDQQGRFEAKILPPGRYLAVALEGIEDGQQTDPEFLESLRAYASPFDLGEGEAKVLSLRMTGR